MATQTFTLEGQSYTVPHGTSMDELDEYIKEQKKGPDALTQQTQATAKAAGAPSAQYPVNIHNNAGETVEHPGAAPIPGTAAIEKQGQRLDLLGRRESQAMRSPTPFSNAVSVYAPVQAAEQVAASKVGGYAGAKVAPHVGLTPEQGELAGGVLGNLGVGAVHGASAVKDRLEMPEKLNLPMGAKFRLKTPNPYEEMGASAQYRDVARDVMKPPAPTVDPVAQAVKARTANWIPTKVTPPGEAPLPVPMRAHAEMEADLAKRAEAPAPLPLRAHAEMTADIQAAQQERAAAQAAMNQDVAANRQGRAGARSEMYGDLAAARNARTEEIAPANAALTRNPAPIAPRATPPAWKTAAPVAAPETPMLTPARPPVQKVPEPPWITRAAQKAQGGFFEGAPAVESPATRPGTPRTAIPEERPTSTEEFLTNLVKKPIWTPEDSVDVRNAFGRDGLMRPGEGQTQYRARLMGMIRSSRAAQGMTDIESYPAPKRPR